MTTEITDKDWIEWAIDDLQVEFASLCPAICEVYDGGGERVDAHVVALREILAKLVARCHLETIDF